MVGGAAGLAADGVVDGRPVGTVRPEEHEGQLRQLALQQPERVDQPGQVLARLLGAEREHVRAAVEAGQVHGRRPAAATVGEPSGTTATRSAPSSSPHLAGGVLRGHVDRRPPVDGPLQDGAEVPHGAR